MTTFARRDSLRWIRSAVTAIALLGMQAAAFQSPSDFEVASIHPNTSGEQNYRIRTPPGGRFTGTNVTVKTLLLYAFDIKDFQMTGAPGWIGSERFDLDAKLGVPQGNETTQSNEATISPESLRPLLRSLLAARFGLTFHPGQKEATVYSLVAARSGPKLHANDGVHGHSTDWGKDHINAMAVTITEFGRVLESQLDRIVVDDTGIAGNFDFQLKWTPDQTAEQSGPSLFTAIQEQYGLRLESKKSMIDVIVIDRVERPTEN